VNWIVSLGGKKNSGSVIGDCKNTRIPLLSQILDSKEGMKGYGRIKERDKGMGGYL
jgi:hypothetical protein